jgi:hypothetical protein
MTRMLIHSLTRTGAAGMVLLIAGAASATFTTITIDGDFSDWAGVPVAVSDPADNVGEVDLADIQIANDADFLYLRMTYHAALAESTYIALDVDENTATGFDVFSLGLIGSEAAWQNDFPFTQSTGVFNDGGGMSGDFFGSGAALLSPSGNSSSRELALSLAATFNVGGTPVFPDDSIRLLIYTDAGPSGDVASPISYTLSVIPEPSTLALVLLGGLGIAARRRRA